MLYANNTGTGNAHQREWTDAEKAAEPRGRVPSSEWDVDEGAWPGRSFFVEYCNLNCIYKILSRNSVQVNEFKQQNLHNLIALVQIYSLLFKFFRILFGFYIYE